MLNSGYFRISQVPNSLLINLETPYLWELG